MSLSSIAFKRCSLIIPCYNEEASLGELVGSCIAADFPEDFEVVLVDNGSTDGTADTLKNLLAHQSQIRSVRLPVNRGYGGGILYGLQHARGQVLGWSHADLQADVADFKKAVELMGNCRTHVYVKGSRFGRAFSDVLFSVGMSVFEMCLLRRFFWDINAQPNVFSRDFYESWDDPPLDFSLDLFVYFAAKKAGLRIMRFPVFFGDRRYGASHWNVDWKSKMKFIKRTVGFSLRLKSKYD